MKSTGDSFDDAWRERLLRYEELPEKDLWKGIAPKITSLHSDSDWTIWINIASLIAVLGIGTILLLVKPGIQPTVANLPAMSAITYEEPIQRSAMNPGLQPIESSATQEINSKDSEAGNIRHQRSVTNLLAATTTSWSNSPVAKYDVNADPAEDRDTLGGPGIEAPGKRLSLLANIAADTIPVDSLKGIQPDSSATKKGKNDIKRLRRRLDYSLYAKAMPLLGYQTIEPNPHDTRIIEGVETSPAFSSERWGWKVEVGVELPISKKFTIFGGLLYYQAKQTISYTEKQVDSTRLTPGLLGQVVIEPVFSDVRRSFEYEIRNIGMQLGGLYKISPDKPNTLTAKDALVSETMMPRKKFSHWVGSGLELHKALQAGGSGDVGKSFSDPSMYLFVNVFYRLQYPSEGRLQGIIEPAFNYSFSINENLTAPFYIRPYSFGLRLGCMYRF